MEGPIDYAGARRRQGQARFARCVRRPLTAARPLELAIMAGELSSPAGKATVDSGCDIRRRNTE